MLSYGPKNNLSSKIPFTAAAYAKNSLDFERLTQERKDVIVRLQTAREMGDLSENGAYIYAKLELGNVTRRLRYLEHVLSEGYVPEVNHGSKEIDFGSTVTLVHKVKKTELKFMLVSEHESDPTAHKLSLQSPIGAATLGKKEGDEVKVTTPNGEVSYLVKSVE